MQHPLRHWVSLRVRIICVTVLLAGSLLPPYVPQDALANTAEGMETVTNQVLLVEEGFLMKTSSLTEQGARRAYAEGLLHVVREGETLTGLAARYGLNRATIEWVNKLPESTPLKPGQELVILPVDGVLHTVSRGQTLARIAELYSVPPDDIRRQNKLEGDFILAGQELIIPGGKPIIEKPVVVAVVPPKPTATTPAKPNTPGPNTPKPISQGGTVPKADAVATAGVLQMPCNNCFYTQYFGPSHFAVDIQTRGGGPIFASEDGTVQRADLGWNGGYGNVIEIDHGNGLVTLYAHNKELYVREGAEVKRGQLIAWMGNTGRVYGKTGIHTHFEVRLNGVKKNPLLYLK